MVAEGVVFFECGGGGFAFADFGGHVYFHALVASPMENVCVGAAPRSKSILKIFRPRRQIKLGCWV